MKNFNLEENILSVIRRENRISRIELSKFFNVSPATIGKIINRLLEKKLIIETTFDTSTGGRKPIFLEINENFFGKILGVYFAPNYISISIGDINGKLSFTLRKKISEIDKDPFYEVENIIETLLKKYKDIHIISIVLNGLVDSKNGILIFSPHYNIKNFSIKNRFYKKFKKHIIVENDVRSMAITEKIFGNCKENYNFVVLNIEDGVGGSIYINNRLYHGYDSISGELGHMTIKRDSLEKCLCGKKGCLETEVSNRAIIKKILNQIKVNQKYSSLKKILEEKKEINIFDVVDAFTQKDMLVLNVIEDAIHYISIAIDIIISVINPEKIMIFGDIFQNKQILEILLKKIKKITLDEQNYRIELSKFSKNIEHISPFAIVNYYYFYFQ